MKLLDIVNFVFVYVTYITNNFFLFMAQSLYTRAIFPLSLCALDYCVRVLMRAELPSLTFIFYDFCYFFFLLFGALMHCE